MKGNKVLHTIHQAAVALGTRSAMSQDKKVSPKVNKTVGKEAGAKLGRKGGKAPHSNR
jgi:hypothetical protein